MESVGNLGFMEETDHVRTNRPASALLASFIRGNSLVRSMNRVGSLMAMLGRNFRSMVNVSSPLMHSRRSTPTPMFSPVKRAPDTIARLLPMKGWRPSGR